MMLKILIIILYASGVVGVATSKDTYDDMAACEKQRPIDTAQWEGLIRMQGNPGRVVSKCATDEQIKQLLESSGLEKGKDDSI